jgi:hypothetical protein
MASHLCIAHDWGSRTKRVAVGNGHKDIATTSKYLHFVGGEPPTAWPYAEGKVRGISIAPLYKAAPKAALLDAKFYRMLALPDAIRSGRTRERKLAIELLEKEIHG